MSEVDRTIRLATGAELPALGLGTWLLDGPGATAGIEHAVELGYRLIDTACDYGSEPHIREALARERIDRGALFLEDKVEEHEDPVEATRERCTALGVEGLDLCVVHRPPPEEPGRDLWEGLIRARERGLCREIGVSNYSPAQIDELIDSSGEVPVVNQIEWSPFGFSHDVLDHARDRGVVIQAYSPLTRGDRLDDETLSEIGSAHGKSAAQVMLRWALQLGVAAVPKASDPAHREENIDVFDFELSDDEVGRLESLNEHYSSLGGLQYL